LTHAFQSLPEVRVSVNAVISEGRSSSTQSLLLPKGSSIESGELLPGERDPPLRVLRIDRTDGVRVRSAEVRRVKTVWLTPYRGEVVRISIVEGRHTRSVTLIFPPTHSFSVGGSVEVEGRSLRVVGLRARGQTWKIPGDTFSAPEVARVYARRNVMPPEGRRDWIRDRGSPRSRASSISRSGRSRSSPGVRMNRD
jgi:uncharacterized Zn finger protein